MLEIELVYERDPLALLSELALARYRTLLRRVYDLRHAPKKPSAGDLRRLRTSERLDDRLVYALYRELERQDQEKPRA